MALDATHPLYQDMLPDWIVMRDTHAGERQIKEKAFEYLPPTSGMIATGIAPVMRGRVMTEQGTIEGEVPITYGPPSSALAMGPGSAGWRQYSAYRTRAVFWDLVQTSVNALVGLMHNNPPVIVLPKILEPMRLNATAQGEDLQTLLRRINEEQLITGRIGLLADIADDQPPQALPHICTYAAETIRNWVVSTYGPARLEFLVLDESRDEINPDLEWKRVKRYRVLGLSDTTIVQGSAGSEAAMPAQSAYVAAEAIDTTAASGLAYAAPQIAGKTLDQVPFVFVGSKDLVPDPDRPPLLGVARIALALYRGEADYRQTLFMQSQETLTIIGADLEGKEILMGAGGRIDLPQGGDAKFIGVSAAGLSSQRQSLQDDKMAAAEMGAQILDNRGGSAESGDALSIRVAARTATLTSIALAGAQGLERVLKFCAQWKGANPDEVSVKPNLEFADEGLTGAEALAFVQAKALGLPLSTRSLHDLMRARGVTSKTYDEELQEIDEEGPASSGASGAAANVPVA